MPYRFSRFAIGSVLLILLSGCGTFRHLNDPSRSSQSLDVATFSHREIPYETIERNGVSASYNLFFEESDNLSGYRLTLIFRNTGTTPRFIEPRIALQDSGGFVVSPYSYQAFVSEAASLAGTEVPPMPSTPEPTNYRHSGTVISSSTGKTYSYSGTTTSEPDGGRLASSFTRGFAQGAAIRAAKDRKEGQQMLRWANSFWLKSAYDLPAGTAASGAIFFPAPHIGKLPLRLVVEAGGERFEFVTTKETMR